MKDYNYYFKKSGEYGEVTEIKYPIANAVGLPNAKIREVVVFETGELGQIIGLNTNSVRIIIFSPNAVRVGTRLSRTDEQLAIPAGVHLLGQVIDPFGKPLSGKGVIPQAASTRRIDSPPQSISGRKKITRPLATGTALVDIVIPIGQGQRQLILGDRKTGKSTFVLSILKNQIDNGAIAIYAAIGQKKYDIKFLENFMNENPNRKNNMIIVGTSAFESPGLIYLTPFTAMTLAEYFRDMGRNVVVIMDDLLTHAKFYREFALIADVFPGRDSYPGDIFHIHAKLLERAGNFTHETGEVSITCLPVIETQEADFTGYIASNLMSITDGHIFFDSNVFALGRRPAINIPLSVTRVGKQTQDKLMKDVNRELITLFAVFEKVENLSHFGSELSESVKSTFAIGKKVYKFFNQPAGLIVPKEVYLALFCLVWLNLLNTDEEIEKTQEKLLVAFKIKENRSFLTDLIKADTFNNLLKKVTDNKDKIMQMAN